MALSADRNTPKKDGVEFVYPCAASKTFYVGALVVLDTAGNAEPATTATGKIGAGVCQKYVASSSVAAAETVIVRSGVHQFVNGDTITKAHIGDPAYATDDQTVCKLGTGKSQIGVIVDVDSLGVWVAIGAPLAAAATGLLAANNLSDVTTLATAQSNLGLQDSSLAAAFSTSTSKKRVIAGGAAYTVTSADGNTVIRTATDNAVITLPDAAAGNDGLEIMVQFTGADGAAKVSISPHASDKIFGTVVNAAADAVSAEGADKDWILTKATSNKGDWVRMISDGSTGWHISGGTGIWASEP